MKTTGLSRRTFLKKTAIAGSLSPFLSHSLLNAGALSSAQQSSLDISIFSKHLQFLGYEDMAKAVADMGFDGVDLTVRPGGHVEPENVVRDLPKAAEAINKAGLKPGMMTTAVTNVKNAVDRNVLETASKSGFKYYRMGYYHYDANKPIMESMSEFQDNLKALSELNEKLGLVGCYQNHAGNHGGASIWEKDMMLSKTRSGHMGSQYDIRHAVVEGGGGWEIGLRLIHPRIRTIALKDHIWKEVEGRWRVVNVPIGEGMVDYGQYFGLLKKYNVHVPASIHYEYPLGGVESGTREITMSKEHIFKAMQKDLKKIRDLWASA